MAAGARGQYYFRSLGLGALTAGLAGAGGKTKVFPEFVPAPDARFVFGHTVTQLVSEREDLAAVMGVVSEHVGEHGCAGRPLGRPTTPREFRHTALGIAGQRFTEHLDAARGAHAVSGGGLLYGATKGVESGRTSQMRCRMFQPHQAVIVQVGEDRGNGAALLATGSGRLGSPSARVEVIQHKLVH